MKEFIVFLYLTVLMCAFKPVHSMYDLDAEHKKIMEILAEGKWVTDKLSDKLARSHYITLNEMSHKVDGKSHSVRIIVGRGEKSNLVKANLKLMVRALEADVLNKFKGCKQNLSPHSGELDLFFGEAGQLIVQDMPIAIEQKNHHWTETSSENVTGIRIAKGSQGISHIYPLIEKII